MASVHMVGLQQSWPVTSRLSYPGLHPFHWTSGSPVWDTALQAIGQWLETFLGWGAPGIQ